MSTVADYIDIQDSTTTLSPRNELPQGIDTHLVYFDAPALHAAARPVLMLRINPQVRDGDSVTLSAELNDVLVLNQTFDTDMQRSWHEIMDSNILREDDNALYFSAYGADVTISDLVVLYRKVI